MLLLLPVQYQNDSLYSYIYLTTNTLVHENDLQKIAYLKSTMCHYVCILLYLLYGTIFRGPRARERVFLLLATSEGGGGRGKVDSQQEITVNKIFHA